MIILGSGAVGIQVSRAPGFGLAPKMANSLARVKGSSLVRKLLDGLSQSIVSTFMFETYKKHFIGASAVLEETTGKYISVATISWEIDGRREAHCLDVSTERYDRADAAMYFGLAAGKNWVDEKLGIEL